MNRYVVLALTVGLLVGARAPDKGKKGTPALEGTWVVVSTMVNGKERRGAKDAKMVFKGKDVAIKTSKTNVHHTFTIDPENMTIDVVRAGVKSKGWSLKGIYQLKGDELKLCFSQPGKDRPKDFTAGKGSGNSLSVLKRVRDK
jgi:uncharacterized protein (TIGR03067 family)